MLGRQLETLHAGARLLLQGSSEREEMPDKINGYEIEASLGSGAFGHTYRVKMGSKVYAMKVLKPEAIRTEVDRKRFQRECRALQKIRSDHVVAYHDHGVFDDDGREEQSLHAQPFRVYFFCDDTPDVQVRLEPVLRSSGKEREAVLHERARAVWAHNLMPDASAVEQQQLPRGPLERPQGTLPPTSHLRTALLPPEGRNGTAAEQVSSCGQPDRS